MALMMFVAGCGKQAAPQPPIVRVAERTTDLSAVQEGLEAVLRWTYPSLTTSGQALTEIEAIEIWRATLPLAQEPPPPVSAGDRQLQRQLLESQGELLVTLDRRALDEATRGKEIVVRDDLARWRQESTATPASVVIWYGVRTVCCRKRESEFSNVARLLPAEPPPPPTNLKLEAGADGIEVLWDPQPELRVLVERSSDGALWSRVTDEPVVGSSWRDTSAEQGRTWIYRLRSVARPEGGGRVVGEPSPPVAVDHPDTYPPAAPGEVVCLPEGRRVRVRWVAVSGAAVYEVTRRLADGSSEVLAESTDAVELVDLSPPLGELTYLVVARDEVGNASAPSSCTVVMGDVP
jgi:hypothetical protein